VGKCLPKPAFSGLYEDTCTTPDRRFGSGAFTPMPTASPEEDPVVLVTGGTGFLGRFVINELLRDDEDAVLSPKEIRVFDLRPSRQQGVRSIVGDIRDRDSVAAAVEGCDVVIHCAALVDWGRESEAALEAVNVGGTDRVTDACVAAGVSALVHTSTLDVVWSGDHIVDGDESLPYPKRHANAYCSTKAEAERRVLARNGESLQKPDRRGHDQLRAVVVRPCSMFGEGDQYHLGYLLEMARNGRFVRVGDGTTRSQLVYAGNVAHALVLAARAMLDPENRGAGEIYFVTDVPPQNFFEFFVPFVEAAGYPVPSGRRLPRAPLYAVGALLEAIAFLVRPLVRFAPTLTRFAVDFVTKDFTITTDKANRDLGYTPRFSQEEAFARTANHTREVYGTEALASTTK